MSVRILIADDNQVARGLLNELISNHEEWEVCALVENGQEAVAKAAELKPDVIILDLAMPVMNGIDAARKISGIMPSIPIVLFTLHSFPAIELEAKKVGIRAVVSKSEGRALLDAIEKLLKEQKSDSAMAASASAASLATALPQAQAEPAKSLDTGVDESSTKPN